MSTEELEEIHAAIYQLEAAIRAAIDELELNSIFSEPDYDTFLARLLDFYDRRATGVS